MNPSIGSCEIIKKNKLNKNTTNNYNIQNEPCVILLLFFENIFINIYEINLYIIKPICFIIINKR